MTYEQRIDKLKNGSDTAIWAAEEIERLREAIKKTIEDNLHLADGDVCTLIDLKRAINYDA